MADWTPEQISEEGTRDLVKLTRVLMGLYYRSKAQDKADLLKKENKELKRRLRVAQDGKTVADEARTTALELAQKAVGEAEVARKEVAETRHRLDDLDSFAAFICQDRTKVEQFFRAILTHKTGEDLAWVFGDWAYASGRRAMQQEVQASVTEVFEGDDMRLILENLPGEVADPGPNPFTEPSGAASDPIQTTKDVQPSDL